MLSSDGKIHFSCNECGTKLVATTDQVGKSGNCKNCGSPISVPFLEQAEESKTVAEEVKFCPECGNSLKKDAIFCDNCGASMIQKTTPKATLPKRTETWDSAKKKYGLMKYFYAFLIAVFVIGIYLKSPEPTNKTLFNLTTKTPSIYSKKRSAQSKPRAEVLYLNFTWSDRTLHDKVARISGEVKNHSNKTVEVLVTVSARNSQKHIVEHTQVYAPLSGNILPFGTAPFKAHFYNDGRDIQFFEASVAEVKVVR